MNLYIMQESIILASQSLGRKNLLEKIGLKFLVIPSMFDESLIKHTTPNSYVKILALRKANNVAMQYTNKWIISADTIVVIDDLIMGKPNNKAEAIAMLNRLNGRIHKVYTGYAIEHFSKKIVVSKIVKSYVKFKKLDSNEINTYVELDSPYDKSGSYSIQGIGMFMVKQIYGSYTNVIGLPITEIIESLIKLNVITTNNVGR